MKYLACLIVLSIPLCAQTAKYRHDGQILLPDATVTPGAINPELTKEKICSKSFRTGPYRNVPESEKKASCKEYGIPLSQCNGKNYEQDHLRSLEIGGSNDLKNIWPQPYFPIPGAHEKDKLENELHRLVCTGKIELQDAQQCISNDWYACGKRLGIYGK